jgi:hypothetical protein
MHVLLSIISVAAGIVAVVQGVIGLWNWLRGSATVRELEDHKVALAKCQQACEDRELALWKCEELWRWVAFIVVVAGIFLLISRSSSVRSAA